MGKITPEEKTITLIDENNDEWIFIKIPRILKPKVGIDWKEFGIREIKWPNISVSIKQME